MTDATDNPMLAYYTHDPKAAAAYVAFAIGRPAESTTGPIQAEVLVDLDVDGRMIGFEILLPEPLPTTATEGRPPWSWSAHLHTNFVSPSDVLSLPPVEMTDEEWAEFSTALDEPHDSTEGPTDD